MFYQNADICEREEEVKRSTIQSVKMQVLQRRSANFFQKKVPKNKRHEIDDSQYVEDP